MCLQKYGKDTKAATSDEDMTAKLVESHEQRKGKEMKALRALLLVLALSVSASAGWMENDRTGNIPCDKAGDMETDKTSASDPMTAMALQLLQSVLPLF
jgi:hypothetical protein